MRLRRSVPIGCSLLIAACLAPESARPEDGTDARLPGARAAVEQKIAASGAEVAVVLRSLDGKVRMELRATESFHAASTMKIGVMLELYRQLGAGKIHLDEALPVRNEFHSVVDGSVFHLDPADDSDDDPYKQVGATIAVRELCEAMITKSSNLATNLLMERLGIENIQRTVNATGGKGMKIARVLEDGKAFEKGIINTTTAAALAGMMERIARGIAVDATASQEMVAILKRQTFNEGIPAGLPAGIAVAHKTGEITKIHHDAAIVYAPRPFVLVILVRGLEKREASAALMADITRILYEAAERGEALSSQS